MPTKALIPMPQGNIDKDTLRNDIQNRALSSRVSRDHGWRVWERAHVGPDDGLESEAVDADNRTPRLCKPRRMLRPVWWPR